MTEAESITFNALESWSYPARRSHQYSFVTDDQISSALQEDLSNIDLNKPWAFHSGGVHTSTRSDNPIHAPRIAKLVQVLGDQDVNLYPIRIEASEDVRNDCNYCVIDGHHRLRAFQYLGHSRFKAFLIGLDEPLSELRDLVREDGGSDL